MAAVTADAYLIDMGEASQDQERLDRLLSREERDRARRFHLERDRRRYVVRRGRLRELLARYLDCAPAQVRVSSTAYGKPFVAGSDLEFNLSRSCNMALYVVARGAVVGCDIERRDMSFAVEQTAEQFFSREEVRELRSLPSARRVEGFFNCWTRKEAFVKARGGGLSLPLDGFDVSLAPGRPAALLRGGDGWSVCSFEPAPGYQAAMVARGTSCRLNWPSVERRARCTSRVAPALDERGTEFLSRIE